MQSPGRQLCCYEAAAACATYAGDESQVLISRRGQGVRYPGTRGTGCISGRHDDCDPSSSDTKWQQAPGSCPHADWLVSTVGEISLRQCSVPRANTRPLTLLFFLHTALKYNQCDLLWSDHIKTGSPPTFQTIYLMLNSNYNEGQRDVHLFTCLYLLWARPGRGGQVRSDLCRFQSLHWHFERCFSSSLFSVITCTPHSCWIWHGLKKYN